MWRSASIAPCPRSRSASRPGLACSNGKPVTAYTVTVCQRRVMRAGRGSCGWPGGPGLRGKPEMVRVDGLEGAQLDAAVRLVTGAVGHGHAVPGQALAAGQQVGWKDLDRSVVAHLGEHPDAEVFTSLPRSGQVNAAQLLAAWGDCRQAYPQADSVAMLGPVPGHPRLRPPPRRQLPVGLQQAAAAGHDLLRQQLPTRLAVGGRGLLPGRRPRLRPPPCRADPRPRLGTGDLAVLAGQHALRPGPPPGRPPSQSR